MREEWRECVISMVASPSIPVSHCTANLLSGCTAQPCSQHQGLVPANQGTVFITADQSEHSVPANQVHWLTITQHNHNNNKASRRHFAVSKILNFTLHHHNLTCNPSKKYFMSKYIIWDMDIMWTLNVKLMYLDKDKGWSLCQNFVTTMNKYENSLDMPLTGLCLSKPTCKRGENVEFSLSFCKTTKI